MLTVIHNNGIVNVNQQRRWMMTDIAALKECIKKSGYSMVFVAKRTGILRETMYNRLKTGDFKLSEIQALSHVLNLSRDERDKIFFTIESELNSTIIN